MLRLIARMLMLVAVILSLALFIHAYMYSVSVGQPGYTGAIWSYFVAWFSSW